MTKYVVTSSPLAPGQAEALVEAAAPILREILMQHRRRMAEAEKLPGQAHMAPENRAALERFDMDVADAAIHRAQEGLG